MSDGWTPERDELVARLWAEGQSAGEIAATIGGGLTRSAVLGKIHRNRLKAGAPVAERRRASPVVRKRIVQPAPHKPRPAKAVLVVQPRAVPRPTALAVSTDILPPLGIFFPEDIKAGQCKWLVNDAAPYLACGHPALDEAASYCPGHCAVAYVKPRAPVRRGDLRRFNSKHSRSAVA